MSKSIKDHLSLLADLLQVVSFIGLTPAICLALVSMVFGYLAQIPVFYLVVGTAIVFVSVVYLSSAFILRVGTISLADAARIAYEQLRGTLWADAAERMRANSTPEGILDYLATGLSLHIAVYGTYGPSSKSEKIPETDLRSGSIEQGATTLQLRDNRNIFVKALTVRKRELRVAIRHMKESTVEFNQKSP
jgi:hypothetical protein